jgi:SAM-dependent methyltransferase
MASLVDWHARYTQQAGWTFQTREYLYAKTKLSEAGNVLEVGCGTGALLTGFPSNTRAAIFGLDINPDNARQAQKNAHPAGIICGDGHYLPHADGCFDIVLCHFLLLWVEYPVAVLREMKRVTRSGGAVMALAEPDYSGRIDYPPSLEPLGRWQAESLGRQGADPDAGRKLRGWFTSAGITPIESGIMAGGWSASPSTADRELEWEVINSDLAGFVQRDEINKLKSLDEAAWASGARVLFVPTFYAWGRV